MSVRYLNQFSLAEEATVDEESTKRAIGKRFEQIRLERALTRNATAELLEASRISVGFWEQGRVMPGRHFLERIHERLEVDLNWLLRTERSLEQVANREADFERIARIFDRIDAIRGSLRLLMLPQTRALIARAIHFAPEAHEDAFFNLLESRGSVGFTGHKWVMSLDDGRTEELEVQQTKSVTLPQRLKLVRLRTGLTNHGFSGAIGVPQSTWLTWEGSREPQFLKMMTTLGRMDLDLNWLIAGSSPFVVTFGQNFDWEQLLQ